MKIKRNIAKIGIDVPFFTIVLSIVIFGLAMFGSAALGVLASNEAKFYNILATQFFYAFVGGIGILSLTFFIHYSHFKRFSFFIYISTLVLTAAVFMPHIGFAHGGAHRWIHILGFSIQPSELLKYGTIFFLATFLSVYRKHLGEYRYGLIPFLIISGVPFLLLLAQPDTGTGAIILFSSIAMYIVAGAKWRDICIIAVMGIVGLFALAAARPYVHDRILTFFDHTRDSSGSSYQVEQSLIAIGSGGTLGRGYGQSIQKFNFLPEPIGDSIFAVIGEELGFLGGAGIIVLFTLLMIRGFKIAGRVEDDFGAFVIVGILALFFSQVFLNIASMLGLFPLTGVPLPFISHGGTALLVSLFGVGVILNISKYRTVI